MTLPKITRVVMIVALVTLASALLLWYREASRITWGVGLHRDVKHLTDVHMPAQFSQSEALEAGLTASHTCKPLVPQCHA